MVSQASGGYQGSLDMEMLILKEKMDIGQREISSIKKVLEDGDFDYYRSNQSRIQKSLTLYAYMMDQIASTVDHPYIGEIITQIIEGYEDVIADLIDYSSGYAQTEELNNKLKALEHSKVNLQDQIHTLLEDIDGLQSNLIKRDLEVDKLREKFGKKEQEVIKNEKEALQTSIDNIQGKVLSNQNTLRMETS